jgi:hypothetical protein
VQRVWSDGGLFFGVCYRAAPTIAGDEFSSMADGPL